MFVVNCDDQARADRVQATLWSMGLWIRRHGYRMSSGDYFHAQTRVFVIDSALFESLRLTAGGRRHLRVKGKVYSVMPDPLFYLSCAKKLEGTASAADIFIAHHMQNLGQLQ